jgi:hypothetical protein
MAGVFGSLGEEYLTQVEQFIHEAGGSSTTYGLMVNVADGVIV